MATLFLDCTKYYYAVSSFIVYGFMTVKLAYFLGIGPTLSWLLTSFVKIGKTIFYETHVWCLTYSWNRTQINARLTDSVKSMYFLFRRTARLTMKTFLSNTHFMHHFVSFFSIVFYALYSCLTKYPQLYSQQIFSQYFKDFKFAITVLFLTNTGATTKMNLKCV